MAEASSSHKKKLSLKEFVWLGFNYAVGFGFVGNFAVLSNADAINSIGMNAVWVFVLIGIVAGTCALAFTKLSKIYNADSNGGTYIYVRANFGRFLGWLVGFMQYACLPFIVTIQVMMLIKGTFAPEYTSHNAIQWYSLSWGPFGDLWLDLIGITIYMGSALIIFGGIKLYKIMAHFTLAIKWVTGLCLVAAGLYLAIQNGSSNWNYWMHHSSFSFAGFMNTFTSCFFFFAGFEIFSTAGKNIVNPEKNISRGVNLIMIVMTFFYIILSIIFFLGYTSFAQNMNMGAWIPFKSKLIIYGGPIMMIIMGIALKVNISMQNSLYGATTLQPLSKEGYIPDALFKLNNDGIPVKAAIVNLVVTAFMLVLWLIVPDLIKGFYLLFAPKGTVYPSAFNVGNLSAAFSVITMFVYIMVLITVLKLGIEKKLKFNIYEKISYPIVLFCLLVLFVWHYYSLVHDAIAAPQSGAIVAMVIELIFIGLNVSFAIIWYLAFYYRKYHMRLKTDPSIQAKLNSEFNFTEKHQKTLLNLKSFDLRSGNAGDMKNIGLILIYLTFIVQSILIIPLLWTIPGFKLFKKINTGEATENQLKNYTLLGIILGGLFGIIGGILILVEESNNKKKSQEIVSYQPSVN